MEGLQEQERFRPLRIQSVHEKSLHESGRRTWQGGQACFPGTKPVGSRSHLWLPAPIHSMAMQFPFKDSVQASS